MKFKLLGAVSAFSIIAATQVFAADVSGSIGLDASLNATDDIVVSPSLDVAIDSSIGVGSIGLTVDSATDSVDLDSYSIGVKVGGATLSFGDQGDILDGFEGNTNEVGGTTLLNLDDSGESFKVEADKLAVGVRFTDVGADMTDLTALQVGYGTEIGNLGIAAGVDYNVDTEATSTFAKATMDIGSITTAGTISYRDIAAYELSASINTLNAFVNGDENDALQNVGLGVSSDIASTGMSYYVEGGYNLDTEELTPAAGVAFKF